MVSRYWRSVTPLTQNLGNLPLSLWFAGLFQCKIPVHCHASTESWHEIFYVKFNRRMCPEIKNLLFMFEAFLLLINIISEQSMKQFRFHSWAGASFGGRNECQVLSINMRFKLVKIWSGHLEQNCQFCSRWALYEKKKIEVKGVREMCKSAENFFLVVKRWDWATFYHSFKVCISGH